MGEEITEVEADGEEEGWVDAELALATTSLRLECGGHDDKDAPGSSMPFWSASGGEASVLLPAATMPENVPIKLQPKTKTVTRGKHAAPAGHTWAVADTNVLLSQLAMVKCPPLHLLNRLQMISDSTHRPIPHALRCVTPEIMAKSRW